MSAVRSMHSTSIRMLLSLSICARLIGADAASPIRIDRIDGTILDGSWRGLEDAATLKIETAEALIRVPVNTISQVSFPIKPEPPPGNRVQFLLNDGGTLAGEILADHGEETVIARTSLADRTVFRFDRLAAIRLAEGSAFPRSLELFESTLRQRLPGQDQLITRSLDEPRVVRGRLESLNAERGAFSLGDSPRTFMIDRMFAVVLASGASPRAPLPASLILSDGTTFSARLRSGDERSLSLETSFGMEIELPVSRILELHFQSERIVYLAQFSPVEQHVEGRLHRPWPIRVDRGVAGAPLTLNGRVFRRGIGVHSYTELAFELDAPFESFAATIGIDDSVRPRGDVVFRVLGEEGMSPQQSDTRGTVRLPLPTESATGPRAVESRSEPSTGKRLLFDSGPVTGRDAGRDILVDIRGVRRLWLVVDFGEQLDLSDHANWADARLIKPAKTSTNP